MSVSQKRPELVAPAGDPQCARAAVENGADAVYFGLRGGFNARVRAVNFDLGEVAGLMTMLRRQGVKGYVTLNTLVFSDELARLEETVQRVLEAGVDAIIVQDLGLLRLIRQVCPAAALHASTQMTLSSAECLQVVEPLGAARVVLPRELSLAQIAAIRAATAMELEVFVHGALCVSYSGQCLASEVLGGRSANRGECAQACRLDYQLTCDGRDVDLGPRKYLLSPLDLAAFDVLPKLVEAGVSAFKIEGRLKSPEYVANVVRVYRQALDAAIAGRPAEISPRQVEELEVTFSRGFSRGWLEGPNHQTLVPGVTSAKRGLLLGTVRGVRRERVQIELAGPVKRGDGVAFEGDRREKADQGGRVYEVFLAGRSVTEPVESGLVELSFGHGAIDVARLQAGQRVWKTDDPQLARELRKSFTATVPQRRVPLDLTIIAAVGAPLLVEGRAENGAACRVTSENPLAQAEKHPLTAETLSQQLGRLGETVYTLRDVQARIDGTPMIPLSQLGRLRHELVRQLDESIAAPPQRAFAAEPVLPRLRAALAAFADAPPAEPQLHVLCRQAEQVQTVLEAGVRSLIVEFHDMGRYADAIAAARQVGATILLASPRIQKPGEMGLLQALARHAPDGMLARNLAALNFCRQERLPAVADFSLNAVNELTVGLLREAGASRVAAAYDLDRQQLLSLAAAAPPAALEVVVHQHVPMFHMEHCLFCSLLSPGTSNKDCGRPCDRHTVRLRDHVGEEHLVASDVACRNTVFHAMPQSAAETTPDLIASGVRHFRVELLDEAGPTIAATLSVYQRLLAGELTGREAWVELRDRQRGRLTRGTFDPRQGLSAVG